MKCHLCIGWFVNAATALLGPGIAGLKYHTFTLEVSWQCRGYARLLIPIKTVVLLRSTGGRNYYQGFDIQMLPAVQGICQGSAE